MPRPKPRILWNAKDMPGLHSGYGIVGQYLLPLLADRYGKDNVIIYAPVYQRDQVTKWHGMTVLPGNEFTYGENLILEHYQALECNILLMVGDAWPLGTVPDLAKQGQVYWVQWMPVDTLHISKNLRIRIENCHQIVPFTRDGEARLKRAGFTNVSSAIWLGINTEVWKPLQREAFPAIMRDLGFSYDLDALNILIVAANQRRKYIRHQLEAVALLRQSFSQIKPHLYIHSLMKGDRDLLADLDELNLGDIVFYPEPYAMMTGGFTEKEMVKMVNCADVVLNCCLEGFGFAITNAQACGVPVITMAEGPGAELVVAGVQVPSMGPETEPHMMTYPIPNPIAVATALEEVWQRKQKKGAPLRSEKSVNFIRDNFSWATIAEQWFRVIDKCMEDRESRCLDIPAPSPACRRLANQIIQVA